MKDLKCLVLLVILLGFTISSSAQSFISSIEVFGGTSHSYLRWDFPYRQNLNLSFLGGIGLTHFVSERLEIDAKFMVEEKGFQTDYVETLFDANNNSITSRYIQSGQLRYATLILIPRIIFGHRNHFLAGIGSYFSLLNKASETVERYSIDGSQFSFNHTETTKNFRPLDFGISAAIGHKKHLGTKIGMTSQLLLNWGLTNISDLPLRTTKIRNVSISFLVGLNIN